jgi:hypothetical protein
MQIKEFDNNLNNGMMWKTMEGGIIHTSQMSTSHLFNSVKMIYNHMADIIGFPTFWFRNKYEEINKKWLANPEYQMDILKKLILELEKRDDWDERQKHIYNQIKLTLTGEFHSIVLDALEKRGFERSLVQLQDPIKLLKEAKEKYERKQLNSID